MMKKLIAIMFMILTIVIMSACGSSEQTDGEEQQETVTEESTEATAEATGDTMVIYFSVTGHTKTVAEMITQITDADIYEIEAEEPYTDADIDYSNDDSRASIEQNDKSARPAFAGDPPSLEGVKTLYLGYPIWFGQEPRIMDTFVKAVNFDGITVIPFCTSGSSGIGDSGKNLEQIAGSGSWLAGERFAADTTEEEVQSWIDSLQE